VAVAIRMKRMGRKNRAFYRICATDKRSPRDGREIEVLGTYDPSIADTDARCALDGARVQYWLSVGAQPSQAVRVLIKKYGPAGTRLKEMETARAKLALPRVIPDPGPPAFVPEVKTEPAPEAAGAAGSTEAPAAAEPVAEAPGQAEAVAEAPSESTTGTEPAAG
jgi:small subunit ribosomal protein S16